MVAPKFYSCSLNGYLPVSVFLETNSDPFRAICCSWIIMQNRVTENTLGLGQAHVRRTHV